MATVQHRILVIGDSLAATAVGGMLAQTLDDEPFIDCTRRGKSASGLARPDFFDWPREADALLAKHNPTLVVVMMGGNDGQDLRSTERAPNVHWGSDAWREAYAARVRSFLAQLAGNDREIAWIELPPMGLRSLEKKLELIREIQRAQVEALGERAHYIETRAFLANTDGSMLNHLPHAPKDTLRADDRIHFTMAGSRYIARKLADEVIARLP